VIRRALVERDPLFAALAGQKAARPPGSAVLVAFDRDDAGEVAGGKLAPAVGG
jgi:hypothetical protein